MTAPNPFDARPDERLGHLLREYLDAPDHAVFVARVRAAVARETPTSWDVLAAWARPGLAAVAVVAFLMGLWLGIRPGAGAGEPMALEDTAPVGAPAQLVGAAAPPGPDLMLAAVMEEEP